MAVPIHARNPTSQASHGEPNNDRSETAYASTTIGSAMSDDACWAAAPLDTCAEMDRMSAMAIEMSGGTTQNMKIHQLPVGNRTPSVRGARIRFTTTE